MTTADRNRDSTTAKSIPPQLLWASAVLIAVLTGCAVFFLADVVTDMRLYWRLGESLPFSVHIFAELVASLALVVAIVLALGLLIWLLRRQALLEHDLALAGAAVDAVVLAHFDLWRLTGAEQDVALFVVKGQSISEIAALRGSSEATVKSHLNAIYRKSGSTGRSDLLAILLEALMGSQRWDGHSNAARGDYGTR